jgi:hypothetical protein
LLRKILRAKRKEVMGDRRKLYSEELTMLQGLSNEGE